MAKRGNIWKNLRGGRLRSGGGGSMGVIPICGVGIGMGGGRGHPGGGGKRGIPGGGIPGGGKPGIPGMGIGGILGGSAGIAGGTAGSNPTENSKYGIAGTIFVYFGELRSVENFYGTFVL